MSAMTDREIEEYLRENDYPEHVARGGREGLIRRWREFVEQVEKGYPLGLEDYRNDLDLRGIISMLELDNEVRDSDERFARLLTACDRRVWESAASNPFWDFGHPSNAGEELLADLRAESLLDDAAGRPGRSSRSRRRRQP